MQNNSTVSNFLKQSSYLDYILWVGEFTASKFLAITTSVLAWGLFNSFLVQHVSEEYLTLGRIIIVGFLYLLIDVGLTSMLKWYWSEKDEQKRNQEAKRNPHRRLFLSIIFYLIVFRFVATLTSSFWAAPEVANAMTGDFHYEYFINKLTTQDSLQAAREGKAFSYIENLSANEKERISSKADEASDLIKAAVTSGDYWQRSSYAKEGFGWINNRANKDQRDKDYAQRIKNAQLAAAKLISAEKAKTEEAVSNFAQVQNDTSHAKIVSAITNLSTAAQLKHEAKLNSKQSFIYLFDFFAGAMLLFCTWLRMLRKKAAGGTAEENKKTVGVILSTAWSQFIDARLQELEDFFGVDINGDGQIGNTNSQSPTATTHTYELPSPELSGGIGFHAIRDRQPQPKQREETVPETTVSNIEKQLETVLQKLEKQSETTNRETAKQIVPQQKQRETTIPETVVPPSQKQSETIRETKIVSAPDVDVSDWRKRAVTYFKRAHKPTSSVETRDRNYETYCEYRDLLESTGKFELIEDFGDVPKLTINEIKRE